MFNDFDDNFLRKWSTIFKSRKKCLDPDLANWFGFGLHWTAVYYHYHLKQIFFLLKKQITLYYVLYFLSAYKNPLAYILYQYFILFISPPIFNCTKFAVKRH